MLGAPEVYFLALVLWFESARVLVGQGNMAWEETRRIHRFDDLSFAQEDKLLEQAVPAKTRVATDFWLGVFQTFCAEKGINIDLATCSASDLDDCLKKFYGGLRTKKGLTYQKGSYMSARSAIQRHLTYLKRPFNVRSDSAFNASNRILDAVLKHNKAHGLAKPVEHKDAITEEDKVRLRAYFADVLETQDTYKLQSFCWFNIARHFALRGGEVFARIKRTDFDFRVDEEKKEYVVLKTDFLTKNSPGGISSREFKSCGMLKDEVQVQALRRLLARLHPNQERMFQRVLPGVRSVNGPWFMNAPLGHNALSDMMPLLSVRARLSNRYTNHCVRASVVTDLKDAGYSNHEVCAVTGHKNEASVQHYDRIDRPGSDRPAKMADILDGKPPAKKPCTGDVSGVLETPLLSPTAAPEFKRSSTMGGISLSGNAVIHQLTINFTRTESESSDIASKQHLHCQIRKPLPDEEQDLQSQPLEPEIA